MMLFHLRSNTVYLSMVFNLEDIHCISSTSKRGIVVSRQRSMEKIRASEFVTIGELVRLTGSRYSTLKYYTEEGMLPFEQEEENLTRRFPRIKAIARIEEIKEFRKQGYTIADIKAELGNNAK